MTPPKQPLMVVCWVAALNLAALVPSSQVSRAFPCSPRSSALFASVDSQPVEAPEQPPLPPPSRGLAVLGLVPVAWGTYGPAIKTLYALDSPPPELLFAVLNYVISAAALTVVSSILSQSPSPQNAGTSDTIQPVDGPQAASAPDGFASVLGLSPPVALAGIELAAYLFVGTTLGLFGLQRTTSGRAAFIVQLTTVIVPLLEAALARTAPSRKTLGLCASAFAGVALMVTAGGDSGQAAPTLVGDGLMALSAVAYSLQVVRLGYHAPRHAPIELARAKEAFRLLYAIATLGVGLAFAPAQAASLAAFLSSFVAAPDQAALALALVAWSGVVTTAFATWGQTYGQSAVSAPTASIIYASQPIWSSAFGYAVLGETFGPQAAAGACIVLAAVGAAAVGAAAVPTARQVGKDSGGSGLGSEKM